MDSRWQRATAVDPAHMTLLVLAPHPENTAPGQRLKFEQYYRFWRAAGWTVIHDAFYSAELEARLRNPLTPATCLRLVWACLRRVSCLWHAARADVVYLFLEAVPVGPPILEWLIVHVLRRPVVYDLDDCVFLPKPGSRATGIPSLCRRERKIAALMRWARHVIVCTAHLESMAKAVTDAPVTRISSTIDAVRYQPRIRPASRKLTIGWSGSFSTSPYLHQLDEVLCWVQRTHGVAIRVIGDPAFRIEGCEIEALPWRADTEVRDLAGLDIGLYPLAGTPWDLGKSGLKALQYMALGIPVIATPFGATLELIEEGFNGLLADSREAWQHKLAYLIGHPEARASLGRQGRRTVVRRYSLNVTWPVYRDIVDGARSE